MKRGAPTRDKSHFVERVSREMDEDLAVLDLSARDALAACCRILAHEGHESGLAGQVTALGDKPGTWWTLKFGLGFEEATGERMVLVDEDLKPLKGGRPNPGVRFHVWIYWKRPDVKAIIHTHAPHASALAATCKPLAIAHMDSSMLYGTAHLAEWPGVPVADDEGRIWSECPNDVHALADQFFSKWRESLGFQVGIDMFEQEILAFDPTQLSQRDHR